MAIVILNTLYFDVYSLLFRNHFFTQPFSILLHMILPLSIGVRVGLLPLYLEVEM